MLSHGLCSIPATAFPAHGAAACRQTVQIAPLPACFSIFGHRCDAALDAGVHDFLPLPQERLLVHRPGCEQPAQSLPRTVEQGRIIPHSLGYDTVQPEAPGIDFLVCSKGAAVIADSFEECS